MANTSKKTESALKEYRFIGKGIIIPAAACDINGVLYLHRGQSFSMVKGDTSFFKVDMADLAPKKWQAVSASA